MDREGTFNFTGNVSNGTFHSDVRFLKNVFIDGTLFGGSPVKIGGGMTLLDGDLTAPNDVIVGGDITANKVTAQNGTDSVVGNLQITGNLTGGSPLNIIGGVNIIDGAFMIKNESGDLEDLLTTIRSLRAEIEVLKAR